MGEMMKIGVENRNIGELLPQKYPFLMVDRLLEVKQGEYAKTCKCITRNEPWVVGHFGERAIFPGVLMIENMAQTAALIYADGEGEKKEGLYLACVENVKFSRVAEPGQRIETVAKKVFSFGDMIKVECIITEGEQKIAQGTLVLCVK